MTINFILNGKANNVVATVPEADAASFKEAISGIPGLAVAVDDPEVLAPGYKVIKVPFQDVGTLSFILNADTAKFPSDHEIATSVTRHAANKLTRHGAKHVGSDRPVPAGAVLDPALVTNELQ